MPSNHLTLCHSLLLLPSVFPSMRVFSNESALHIRWLMLAASASVLLMTKQGWFPWDWLVWSPCSWRDSQESSPAPQFKGSNSSALNLFYYPAFTSIHDYRKTIALTIRTFVDKVMFLFFNTLSRFVIGFLPRSKHLLILWLQSPSAVILESKKMKSVTVSIVSPSICHEVMGPDAVISVLWMLNFKPVFFFTRLYHFHQEAF